MKGPANNLVIMHDDIVDAQQTASIILLTKSNEKSIGFIVLFN